MSIMKEQRNPMFDELREKLFLQIAEKSIEKCEKACNRCLFWGIHEVAIPMEILKENK